MKPTIQLINALRKAADRIETAKYMDGWNRSNDLHLQPGYYRWSHPCTCNCGILAQELGMSAKQIDDSGIGLWGDDATDYFTCSVTRHPMGMVFAYLSQFGLERDDFSKLEWAGVDEKSPLCEWRDQQFVARYFRAQADILEEQLGDAFELRPLTLPTPAKPVEAV